MVKAGSKITFNLQCDLSNYGEDFEQWYNALAVKELLVLQNDGDDIVLIESPGYTRPTVWVDYEDVIEL